MRKVISIMITVLIIITTSASALMAGDSSIQGFEAVFNFGTFETHFGLGLCNAHKEYESSSEPEVEEWCPVTNFVVGAAFQGEDRRGLGFFAGLGYLDVMYAPPVYPLKDKEDYPGYITANIFYLDTWISYWGWDIEFFFPIHGSEDFHSQALFGGGITRHINLPFWRKNTDLLLGIHGFSFKLKDVPVTYSAIALGVALEY